MSVFIQFLSFYLSNSFCRCSVNGASTDVKWLLSIICCLTKICDLQLVGLDQRSWKILVASFCRVDTKVDWRWVRLLAVRSVQQRQFWLKMSVTARRTKRTAATKVDWKWVRLLAVRSVQQCYHKTNVSGV